MRGLGKEKECIVSNKKIIKSIDNQYKKIDLNDIKKNGELLRYIKEQTEEICLEAVKEYGPALRYVKEQTDEICLEAVKKDGISLLYVKEQNEEICKEAVKNYGLAIKYVKDQTYDICLSAVGRDGKAIEFVKEQTEELCLIAIKHNSYFILKCKEKTPLMCFYAGLAEKELLSRKNIENGFREYVSEKRKLTKKIFVVTDKYNLKNDYIQGYEIINVSSESLEIVYKDLLDISENNCFVVSNEVHISKEVIMNISISFNRLIVLKGESDVKPLYEILANKIITDETLKSYIKNYKISFKEYTTL